MKREQKRKVHGHAPVRKTHNVSDDTLEFLSLDDEMITAGERKPQPVREKKSTPLQKSGKSVRKQEIYEDDIDDEIEELDDIEEENYDEVYDGTDDGYYEMDDEEDERYCESEDDRYYAIEDDEDDRYYEEDNLYYEEDDLYYEDDDRYYEDDEEDDDLYYEDRKSVV